MARFEDYHRTVVGYHGTTLGVALKLVNRISEFTASKRDYDWLGRGVYFWEHAPEQALTFARIRQNQLQKKKEKTPKEELRASDQLAVVACTIRLGFCLDLAEPENVKYIADIFESYKTAVELAGDALPKNNRKYRKLDNAVFEYAYKLIEDTEPNVKVDSARGIYVPKDGAKRIWDGCWLSHDTHIQLCVRNQANLLGTWLHYPTKLEVNDVCQALQTESIVGPQEDSEGKAGAQKNAEGPTD